MAVKFEFAKTIVPLTVILPTELRLVFNRDKFVPRTVTLPVIVKSPAKVPVVFASALFALVNAELAKEAAELAVTNAPLANDCAEETLVFCVTLTP